MLSHIAGALGEHGISIESVLQKGRGHSGKSVPVVVMTHPAQEAAVRRALRAIDELPPQDRDRLHIRQLVDIPAETYLAVPTPPGPEAFQPQT